MSKVFKAVGKAIGGVFKAIGKVVKAVVDVVSSVVNFVLQPFMGLLGGGMPDAGQEAQRQDGVLVQRSGSNQNIPVIYGMRQVGGIVTFAETGSSNNQYLWVAYVLGEGPVEGLRELFIDDYQIDNKYIRQAMSAEGQPVSIGDGKYKDRVLFQFFPGTFYDENNIQNSVVKERSILADSPNWRDDYYYNGLAVLFVRYYWKKIETQADSDNNPFSGSIPEIKATILGRKVNTLITGTDFPTYGVGERYSTNPAEILCDYLRNPRYGKGLKDTDLDWTTWNKSALKCNQEVNYVGDLRGPILTCNYVLETGNTLMANVKILLSGFRAYMPYVQGKYKLKIEDAGDPDDILSGSATIAASFDQDNIQGNVVFTGIEKSAKYTSVKVTWVDPDNKYSTQSVVWPETEEERQTFIDLDGGRENTLESTFGTITNYAMAKDMARLLFNKGRYQETCQLTVTSQALELEPGDIIRINSNILDFDQDPWRIVSIRYNDDMTVGLGCVRNQEDIYPHTRLNEEDIVLPPYIPKGATIYYPTSQNDPLVGLIPPTHVPGYNETDPNQTAGGGVGAPNGSINSRDPRDPPVEVPIELRDTAPITNIIYTSLGGGLVRAEFEFVQPTHVMYDSILFYYKTETENGYKEIEITDKAGPGQIVRFTIDTVIRGVRYQSTTRVKYSTGEYSSFVSHLGFVPQGGTFDDGIQLVSPGWEPPKFEDIEIRDNLPLYILAPIAANGSGGERRLSISAVENLGTQAPNTDIVGMYVFWKPQASEFWFEQQFNFQQDYQPGLEGEFLFTGDIGLTTDTDDIYDFIFRYYYADGKMSVRQIRYMNVDVTNDNSGYSVFARTSVTSVQERASDYPFDTIAKNQGAVADPRLVTLPTDYVTVRLLGTFGNQQTFATFGVGDCPTPANNVYLRGVRVYARPYNPFQINNQWLSYDVAFSTANLDSQGYMRVSVPVNTQFEYEFAVVARVRDGTDTVDANECLYLIGTPQTASRTEAGTTPLLPNDVVTTSDGGTYLNFLSLWQPRQRNTSEVLATVQTVKTQPDPQAQIRDFSLVNTSSYVWGRSSNANILGSVYRLTWNVSHIGVSYAGIRVYRRKRYADFRNAKVYPQYVDTYYGVGRWEYVDISGSYSTNDTTIFLRPPIHWVEFEPNGSVSSFWNNSERGYPISAPTVYDEFIVVIRQTGGVLSDTGLHFGGAFFPGRASVNNLRVIQPVTLADYDLNIDSARQLSNAVNVSTSRPTSSLTAMEQLDRSVSDIAPAVRDLKGISYSAAITGGTIY